MPLYWDGQPWGTLTFITGNRIHVAANQVDVVTQGEIPWFLDHFHLQGFTGRAWAAKLGFEPNPDNWSLAQTLFVNYQHAYDALGAISGGRPDMHRDEMGYTPVAPSRAAPGHESAWQQAREMALVFWRAVADTEMISPALRGAAKRTAKLLAHT